MLIKAIIKANPEFSVDTDNLVVDVTLISPFNNQTLERICLNKNRSLELCGDPQVTSYLQNNIDSLLKLIKGDKEALKHAEVILTEMKSTFAFSHILKNQNNNLKDESSEIS
jgi:hypothetical protein